MGIAWVCNRINKNEKVPKDRGLKFNIQLNNKLDQTSLIRIKTK